ncbi:MAG: helix-turn-helix transcriptional regulator [Gemmataceae bacterium]
MGELPPISDALTQPCNARQFAELLAESIANRLAELLGVSKAAPPDPMMIDAWQFAELLGVSRATIDRRKSAGKLPKHVELSPGCHKWRTAEVRAWIDAGCPPIKEWEARNSHGRR